MLVYHSCCYYIDKAKKKLDKNCFYSGYELLYSKAKRFAYLSEAKQIIKLFCNFDTTAFLLKKKNIEELLQSEKFDNWEYEEHELLGLIEYMIVHLEVHTFLRITSDKIKIFLTQVYIGYNNNPFHNFQHCFCVTQMTYAIILKASLKKYLSMANITALFLSALCHDLDHPGLNNTFHLNAQTKLAILYNDFSPLENHHCSQAFQIFLTKRNNILKNLSFIDAKTFRSGVISCILSTDMSRHNDVLQTFSSNIQHFDFNEINHVHSLLNVIIKVADISNEVRPASSSTRWLNNLLDEFENQSLLESQHGYPITIIERSSHKRIQGQINFIKFVLLPLFNKLTAQLPSLKSLILIPVQTALVTYQNISLQTSPTSQSSTPSSKPNVFIQLSQKKSPEEKYPTNGLKTVIDNEQLTITEDISKSFSGKNLKTLKLTSFETKANLLKLDKDVKIIRKRKSFSFGE